MDKDTIPCPLDFPFTCSEIKKGIRKIKKKNGKKEGPDLILNEFTKTGSQTMTLIVVNVHQYGTAHLYILFIYLGIQMIVITTEALLSQAAEVNYLLHYYKKDLENF